MEPLTAQPLARGGRRRSAFRVRAPEIVVSQASLRSVALSGPCHRAFWRSADASLATAAQAHFGQQRRRAGCHKDRSIRPTRMERFVGSRQRFAEDRTGGGFDMPWWSGPDTSRRRSEFVWPNEPFQPANRSSQQRESKRQNSTLLQDLPRPCSTKKVNSGNATSLVYRSILDARINPIAIRVLIWRNIISQD
jgi:hypothetical protein